MAGQSPSCGGASRRQILWLVPAAGLAGLVEAAPSRAQEAPANFVMEEPPQPLPEIRFQDAAGKPLGLAEFRGKVVLLNIWATWCVPCRQEMPALDRLQAKLGGTDFTVLPLSIDRAGMKAVDVFYREVGISELAKYIDSDGESAGHLGVLGVPTTFLVGRDGRVLGRLIGPAKWDSAQTVAFLRKIIAGKAAP